jgi:hypothetical protein
MDDRKSHGNGATGGSPPGGGGGTVPGGCTLGGTGGEVAVPSPTRSVTA